jgi:hypothetical protein
MSGLDLNAFTRGSSNFLLDLPHQATFWAVAGPAFIAAVLLGFAAYTDLFRGRIIYNEVNAALAFIGLGMGIWLFRDHLGSHFLWFGVSAVVLIAITMIGAIKEGDLKLYLALALFFDKGISFLVIASFVIIIVYGIPGAVRKIRQQRASGNWDQRGQRLGMPPGGPGIALAVPLTLYVSNVPGFACLAFLLVEVGVVLAGMAQLGSWTIIRQCLADQPVHEPSLASEQG